MFIFAINLWHRKFVIAYVAAVFFKRINMVFTRQDKILIKSLYLKGCTAKGLTDDEFPEKSSTKRGVNQLLTKLRNTEPLNATTQQPALFRSTHILSKKITMSSYT